MASRDESDRESRRALLRAILGGVGGACIGGCAGGAVPLAAVAPSATSRAAMPLAIVLGPGAEVLDFAGPLEVFAAVNGRDGSGLYAPYTVAEARAPVSTRAGLRVVPDHTFESAPSPGVVVIPALGEPSDATVEWVRRSARRALVTMSVCNGAFVLARTGLLDGKAATAHHGSYFRFAATFPDVRLRRGARYVDEGRVATAGGVSSGIDLALRVVDRTAGRAEVERVIDLIEYQGRGWLDPDSNTAYRKMPRFKEAHPLCPVCLMDVDRSITAAHRGVTYYFCMPSERSFFLDHTDVFDRLLAEDAAV